MNVVNITSDATKKYGKTKAIGCPTDSTFIHMSRKTYPVSSSTKKYRGLIDTLHLLHFALSASQLTSGIFSYHGMSFPHFGQWEGGEIMDSSRGMRQMQTLKKLPMHAPITKTKTLSNGIMFGEI
jgi:hypothetical protein